MLFADNSSNERRFFRNLFEAKFGLDMFIAENSLQLIDIFKENVKNQKKFDLVLIDAFLKPNDGFKTVLCLRDIEMEEKVSK